MFVAERFSIERYKRIWKKHPVSARGGTWDLSTSPSILETKSSSHPFFI
jgi:hypothetical protein